MNCEENLLIGTDYELMNALYVIGQAIAVEVGFRGEVCLLASTNFSHKTPF